MNNIKLHEFNERNSGIRKNLKGCLKAIDKMLEVNEAEGYMSSSVLQALREQIDETLEINADVRDVLKVERVKSGDVNKNDLQGGQHLQEHKWNSKIVVLEGTSIDEMDRQVVDNIISKYEVKDA